MGTYIERYVYDAVGNFLQMQHRGSNPAHAGWTRAYDYLETSLTEDGNGGALLKTSNRLTRTTLNPAGNTPQPEAYLHDAHGNMVRMPHLGGGGAGPNMHWDYKDQLRQTDLGGGGVAFYVYDASGQRVRKVWEKAPGLTEERIYLGGFEIFRTHGGPIGTNTATLERETLHVMDDKQRIALVETRTLDTAGDDQAPRQLIRYQFGNHLGSASLELDEQAQIISYEEYTPYGSSSYQAVRSKMETPKRYRYTGKERDEESGLYYYGARCYAPWVAVWISCDPKSINTGVDLYVYCGSNPVTRVDPDGADWQFCNPFSDSECGVVSTVKAAYGAAPVQTTIGVAEGINDFRKAVLPTPFEMLGKAMDTAKAMQKAYQQEGGGVSGVLMAANQANPLYKAAITGYEAYTKEGGGTAGALAAANEFNPAYHAMVAAYETHEAVGRGDYREAGKQGVNTVVGVVGTVAVAVGGASLATKALGVGAVEGATADAGLVAPKGAKGPASGRPFDPSKAGGPIRQLSTKNVRVTPKGIDAVEQHLSRFGPDAENAGMAARLRKIAAGELEATPADMNFYTHELRESVRYRQLGHPTGDPGYDVWNNAHTATLEDYGLTEGPGVLYHPSVKK